MFLSPLKGQKIYVDWIKRKWKINVFEINRKTTGRYISGKYPHQRHFTGRDKYGFFIWKDGNRISGAVFIWISLKENIIMGRNVKDSDYEAI